MNPNTVLLAFASPLLVAGVAAWGVRIGLLLIGRIA